MFGFAPGTREVKAILDDRVEAERPLDVPTMYQLGGNEGARAGTGGHLRTTTEHS